MLRRKLRSRLRRHLRDELSEVHISENEVRKVEGKQTVEERNLFEARTSRVFVNSAYVDNAKAAEVVCFVGKSVLDRQMEIVFEIWACEYEKI